MTNMGAEVATQTTKSFKTEKTDKVISKVPECGQWDGWKTECGEWDGDGEREQIQFHIRSNGFSPVTQHLVY